MATDGPTPTSCNPRIFKKGEHVASLYGGTANAVECWVQAVAKKANAQVDWHYFGGVARVLHLGNAESRTRVYATIEGLKPLLKGVIGVRIFPVD